MHQKINNIFISEACGFVLQYVHEIDFPTHLNLLAGSYPYCKRSTKCSVPFVRKGDTGFSFGDIPLNPESQLVPNGQKTHIVYSDKAPVKSAGGGMYNNAINQAQIMKAYKACTQVELSDSNIVLPCVLKEEDRAAFIAKHDGIHIRFEFTSGKPREAHIVNVSTHKFEEYLNSITDDNGNCMSTNPVVKKAFRTLVTHNVSVNQMSRLSYKNIHDKLPYLSNDVQLNREVDFSVFREGTVIINNMPPGTVFKSVEAVQDRIEFRIGSNQLKELKEEIDTKIIGPISLLLSSSNIIFLNAEEAHSLFSLEYNGNHSAEVTKELARKIKAEFGVSNVVISDEDRPVTALIDGELLQESIPGINSDLSEAIYSLLGQNDAKLRIKDPTGCGDTLAPSFQIARSIPEFKTLKQKLQFAIFWASVVYRVSGSNLKDLPDATLRDLMALCLESTGAVSAA